jgi:hypothetical protein
MITNWKRVVTADKQLMKMPPLSHPLGIGSSRLMRIISSVRRLRGSAVIFAVFALAASAAGQTVVVGTADPNVDVPAVQADGRSGREVVLKGRFSFNVPAIQWKSLANRTVLVSQAAAIWGALDDQVQMATIEGGDNPFAIEAPMGQGLYTGITFRAPVERDAALSIRMIGIPMAAAGVIG